MIALAVIMSTEPAQPRDPAKDTLAYRNPQTADEQVAGWLATTHERFFAGVVDWFVMWVGLLLVAIVVSHLQSDVIRLSLLGGWFTVHFVIDAVLGRTLGRSMSRMVLADVRGGPPTAGQLFLRASIQRLWYWPMMGLVAFTFADEAGVRIDGDIGYFFAMSLWICAFFWLVNSVASPKTGLTLVDRISRVRVLVRQ
jgi:hypothetical protein